jgi:hypothetical protein
MPLSSMLTLIEGIVFAEPGLVTASIARQSLQDLA